MPDAVGFLRWTAAEAPGAHGYWPAQAVATNSLSGHPVMDTMVAVTLADLHQGGQWNEELLHQMGAQVAQMPDVAFTGHAAGTMKLPRPRRERAPARQWWPAAPSTPCATRSWPAPSRSATSSSSSAPLSSSGRSSEDWVEVPGLWTVPHTVPDRILIGGPSNAGALFVDWARTVLRPGPRRRRRCGASR